MDTVGSETNPNPPFKWLRPRSAAEILTATPEPVPWLWQSYLPTGALTLLAAYPKVGKSTLVYPFVRSVVRGEPFLGYPTAKTPVVILSEERVWDVRQRMEFFGFTTDDGANVQVHSLREHPLPFTTEAVDEIGRLILATKARLLIVDTLSAWWDVKDENDNAQVGDRMRQVLRLTGVTGAAVLLVHHEGKNQEGGADGLAIRGASALFGVVDQALMLRRRNGGTKNQRVLYSKGRYKETPAEMAIELVDREYHRVETPDEIRLKVWTTLSVVNEQTEEAICDATKLKPPAVRKALGGFIKQGCVTRSGAGKKGDPYRYRRAPAWDGVTAPPTDTADPVWATPATGPSSTTIRAKDRFYQLGSSSGRAGARSQRHSPHPQLPGRVVPNVFVDDAMDLGLHRALEYEPADDEHESRSQRPEPGMSTWRSSTARKDSRLT